MYAVASVTPAIPASEYVPCRALLVHHCFPGGASVKAKMLGIAVEW